MENTYIISDYANWLNPIIEGLKLSDCVLSYEELSEDWQFDEWIRRNIKANTKCVIIPIELGENRLNSVQGLRIGMHLRLMQSELRYLPIIFITNREDWQIRQMLRDSFDKDHLDYLIGTDGTDFLTPNIAEIKAVVENIRPLNKENYTASFYNNTHILPLEEEGSKHSLANIWGALRLNEVLNLNAITDTSLINRTKELYFKYLRAFHSEDKQTYIDLQPLKCHGKRILLIDDEADKGWASVLKVIFKNADFQYINFQERSFEDTEKDTKEKIINEDWDLILLDLRLNPKREDLPNQLLKTEDYSGAKLLEFIKKHNAGIQVIMLTASNKAWNMKKLLDLGADGYYIKESPEFNFSPLFTKESYDNLKEEIQLCFKAQYLKKAYSDKSQIELHLISIRKVGGKGFEALNKLKMINEIIEIQFPQSLALLNFAKKDTKYFAFAFLSYFKILEILVDYFIEYDEIRKILKFKDNGEIIDDYVYESSRYNKVVKNYWDPYKTSLPVKLYNIIFKKLGFDIQKDNKIARLIFHKNKDRNNFIHPPSLIDAKIFSDSDCIEISNLIKNILSKIS